MDLRGGRQKTSDVQDTKCPICFSKFEDQVLGYLDGCQHRFCLDCILKWSANSTDCPVDRLPFHNLKIVLKGKAINTLDMKSVPKKREMPPRYDFTTFCEVCRSRETDQLLSCNACDLAYHTFCLQPSSKPKPGCVFYCDDCSMILSRKRKREKAESGSRAPKKEFKSTPTKPDLFNNSSESALSQNASAEDPSYITDQEWKSEIISSPSVSSSSSSLSSISSSSSSSCPSLHPSEKEYLLSDLKKRLTINPDGSLFYDMN